MTALYLIFAAILAATLALLLWPARQQKRFCLIAGMAFVAGALGLYAALGAPETLRFFHQREGMIQALRDDIISQSNAVKADPRNIAAWVVLGQSFMSTGQFTAASDAFKQATVLSQGDPRILVHYAIAMIYAADGHVSDDAKKALEMVILQQKDNPQARYFLAVRLLQDGKQAEAMQAMKALYASLPADSPLKAMIDQQIGKK